MPDTEPCSDYHHDESGDTWVQRAFDVVAGFGAASVLVFWAWLIWG